MIQMRKVIIAGSRTVGDYGVVAGAVSRTLPRRHRINGHYEVVSGGARGVDAHGEVWAERHDCEVTRIEPDWDEHGKAAGPIRNKEMADYAAPNGMLIAIWDGESRGTKSMIDAALDVGLETHVYVVNDGDN